MAMTGNRMELAEARARAERLKAELEPHCERVEIAGSIRRRRPTVGDIELVCVPKMKATGLFGDIFEVCEGFVAFVRRYPVLKGDPDGRYMQLETGGATLDLFMARPYNWGSILAIRTGSADWVRERLAWRWSNMGYESRGGVLVRGEEQRAVPEERDLFRLLNLEWVEPEEREVDSD